MHAHAHVHTLMHTHTRTRTRARARAHAHAHTHAHTPLKEQIEWRECLHYRPRVVEVTTHTTHTCTLHAHYTHTHHTPPTHTQITTHHTHTWTTVHTKAHSIEETTHPVSMPWHWSSFPDHPLKSHELDRNISGVPTTPQR